MSIRGDGMAFLKRWLVWGVFFALVWSVLSAFQSPAKAEAEPVDPRLFGAYPAFSMPALSPNAEHYAAIIVTDKGRYIEARRLADDKAVVRVSIGIDSILWMEWADEDHLLVSRAPFLEQYAILGDGKLGEIEGSSVYVLDIADRTFKAPLKKRYPAFSGDYGLGYVRYQDDVLKWPNSASGNLLMNLYESRSRMGEILSPGLYSFSPQTGKAKLLVRPKASVKGHRVDHDGRLRVRLGRTDKKRTYELFDVVSEKWLDYTDRIYGPGADFSIKNFSFDPDILYVASDHEYPVGGLYEYRVSTDTFEKLIARHDVYEIRSVQVSRLNKELTKVTAGDVPIYMSDTYRAIWDNIGEEFPNSVVYVSDWSYDESTLIVAIEYPNNPTRYYVTEVGTGEYREIGAQYPDLGPDNLGIMQRGFYEARDGLRIEAFITLPPGMEGKPSEPIPFMMMPHGGPVSRDYAEYDPLAQVIASRGYGVLQMNFRGSEGYGAEFEAAGEREWGQAMQDDVADGAYWLIENGYADPDKICIVGWSYGGYAALMGAARPQDPYVCAASIAAVTDLEEFVRNNRTDWWVRKIGDSWRDRAELRAHSPVNLADQMEIPIFLAHGQADDIVHVQHGIKMLQALAAAGKEVDEVAFALGDHSLSHLAYRQRLYVRLTAFLDRHLSEAG